MLGSDIHEKATFPAVIAVPRQEDRLMASNAIIVSDDGMEIEAIEAAERAFGAFGLAFQRGFEVAATILADFRSGIVNVPMQRKPELGGMQNV